MFNNVKHIYYFISNLNLNDLTIQYIQYFPTYSIISLFFNYHVYILITNELYYNYKKCSKILEMITDRINNF